MNHKLVVGRNTEDVSQKLTMAIGNLRSNEVARLAPDLLENTRNFLPENLQNVNSFFGLRLHLQKKESMAHSGWLYSRYLAACQKSKIDPVTVVALYKEGFFREFRQFDAREAELFFLGFGDAGKKALKVIIDAESTFNPDDFDSDGYQE
jgi:hypothetical protein